MGGPSSPSYLWSAGCWVLELAKPPKEFTIKREPQSSQATIKIKLG